MNLFQFVQVLFSLILNLLSLEPEVSDRSSILEIKSAEAIIKEHNYEVENHKIVTEDDYILSIDRIPFGNKGSNKEKKKVVLLSHGLGCNTACFVSLNSNESLGYLLADSGYDVWFHNARGNGYSNSHKYLDSKKNPKEFYNFSFHEMGYYDLPATIDYILNITNETSLYYIGYSQGGTIFYILTSERPEYNSKIRLATILASPAVLKHVPSTIVNIAARFIYEFEILTNSLNVFIVPNVLARTFIDALCRIFFKSCEAIAFLGFDHHEASTKERAIKFFDGLPSIVSFKQLYHFGQIIKDNGIFRKYNYGVSKNLEIYGEAVPPAYKFNLITTPVALFGSINDFLFSVEDIHNTAKILPNVVETYIVPDPKFTHFDHVVAENIFEIEYKRILKLMRKY